MRLDNINSVYLIGIGGIGMSALARYFNAAGIFTAGYDRISTSLTDELTREGVRVHFSDDISLIPPEFTSNENCLVIYTPAVPQSHSELQYFRSGGFRIMKRSEVLGLITSGKISVAVAGTHGKTTVSTMLAELLKKSEKGCNAFLGGISKNLKSNLVLNMDSDRYVVEADEFDRSFLALNPEYALITSMDADHLDIYGSYANLRDSFNSFVSRISPGGTVVVKEGVNIEVPRGIKKYSYSLRDSETDFYMKDIKREGFSYTYTFVSPMGSWEGMKLGVYGRLNLENAVAAMSLASLLGIDEDIIRSGMTAYKGVKRRFDVRLENKERIYIDDYAHHPVEIRAFLESVREALPDRALTGIFQPHLYSRTRDFAGEFAKSLSILDNVILLDIYPAREEAIPGVSSQMIFDELENRGERILCNKEQVFRIIEEQNPGVLLTMGAGDIDQICDGLEALLRK